MSLFITGRHCKIREGYIFAAGKRSHIQILLICLHRISKIAWNICQRSKSNTFLNINCHMFLIKHENSILLRSNNIITCSNFSKFYFQIRVTLSLYTYHDNMMINQSSFTSSCGWKSIMCDSSPALFEYVAMRLPVDWWLSYPCFKSRANASSFSFNSSAFSVSPPLGMFTCKYTGSWIIC